MTTYGTVETTVYQVVQVHDDGVVHRWSAVNTPEAAFKRRDEIAGSTNPSRTFEVDKVTTVMTRTRLARPQVWEVEVVYRFKNGSGIVPVAANWACVHVFQDGKAMLVEPNGGYIKVPAAVLMNGLAEAQPF